jgi:hypothetical protein
VKYGINYNTGVVGVDPDAMIAIARHAEAWPNGPARSSSCAPPPGTPARAALTSPRQRDGSSSTAG